MSLELLLLGGTDFVIQDMIIFYVSHKFQK
jgi:hypothetical protein